VEAATVDGILAMEEFLMMLFVESCMQLLQINIILFILLGLQFLRAQLFTEYLFDIIALIL